MFSFELKIFVYMALTNFKSCLVVYSNVHHCHFFYGSKILADMVLCVLHGTFDCLLHVLLFLLHMALQQG